MLNTATNSPLLLQARNEDGPKNKLSLKAQQRMSINRLSRSRNNKSPNVTSQSDESLNTSSNQGFSRTYQPMEIKKALRLNKSPLRTSKQWSPAQHGEFTTQETLKKRTTQVERLSSSNSVVQNTHKLISFYNSVELALSKSKTDQQKCRTILRTLHKLITQEKQPHLYNA